MTLDPQISSEFKQSIKVKARSSLSAGGDQTWGTAATIAARVYYVTDKVELPSGEIKNTTHKIITETEIPLTSLVFLPGDAGTNDDTGRRPLKIEEAVHHSLGTSDFWIVTL